MTTVLSPTTPAGASYIGVDLTPGCIRACQVVRTHRSERVRTLGLGPAGKSMDWDAAFGRVGRALRRRGFSGTKIIVAAPADLCVSAVLEMPAKNTDAPVARLVRMELGREHRLDPAALESAWWDIPAPLRWGGGRPVMSVGCPAAVLREVESAASRAGLHIVAFDSRSMALARGVAATTPAQGPWRLICDLSSGIPTVVMTSEGSVVIEHCSWESPLHAVFERVAAECRTDIPVARQLCEMVPLRPGSDRRVQSFAAPRVVRFIREFLDAAARGVSQCVQYHHHKYGRIEGDLPAVVVAEPWLASRFMERMAEQGDTSWAAADPECGAARGLALWHGEDPA